MLYPISAVSMRRLMFLRVMLPTTLPSDWINQKNCSALPKSVKSDRALEHRSCCSAGDKSSTGLYFSITEFLCATHRALREDLGGMGLRRWPPHNPSAATGTMDGIPVNTLPAQVPDGGAFLVMGKMGKII